jgi:hypothetical protein
MATKPSGKKPAPTQAPTQSTKPARPAKGSAGSGVSAKKRKRVDWDAVERDYRTDHFTNVEICNKHGIAPATLSRQIKKGQEKDSTSWQKDLSAAVRKATNAALMADMVKAKVNEGQEQVNFTVKAAAEVNKQVILSHRERLRTMQADADMVRNKLLQMAEMVSDVREAATLVSALEASARTAKIVIEAERKSFGLDEANSENNPNTPGYLPPSVTVTFVSPPAREEDDE